MNGAKYANKNLINLNDIKYSSVRIETGLDEVNNNLNTVKRQNLDNQGPENDENFTQLHLVIRQKTSSYIQIFNFWK